ncbi:putative plasma membrane low affinity zinc ion transporter [Tothia fuscella]|uniref:Plasma membrane low affinity zinc ion transporter n=1 Tax=Tothia fuscella TaxID=1048955 RepID=A0A9P4NMB1_9PEZI|nr:putative plasma membrane low affinity zinc ion transporter [Tothia fuscella]
MARALEIISLIARQASEEEEMIQVPLAGTAGHCVAGNEYDGSMGLRISAIFVILVGSMFGAWFPIYTKRRSSGKFFDRVFFGAKFFGSGVIIATAFIHLLSPAYDALHNPCLTGPITEYDWVAGIILITIFALFFLELMIMRYANFGHDHGSGSDVGHSHNNGHAHAHSHDRNKVAHSPDSELDDIKAHDDGTPAHERSKHARGEDHLGHNRHHTDNDDVEADWHERGVVPESYAAQMTAIFILEFGVIFHSIFIGLTLAVAGEEFKTLYVVLVFHQTFEGLGLGTRLSAAPWPKSKRWTPYALAVGYAISTPIAIAIGLGLRRSYAPGSQTTLIVNGVFDSISAGILIYTGLVELMAHEFMFSPTMQKAPIRTVCGAFGLMCAGAGLMALLGKWA